MRQIIKAVVNGGLSRLGYRVVTTNPPPGPSEMSSALQRASTRSPTIATIIDIGASNGSWTRKAQRFFPRSKYLLVEANAVHEPELREFAARTPGVEYVLAAAGDTCGELYFDFTDPLGGVASHAHRGSMATTRATTVDHEVRARGLQPPYMLKLDTHGFEVPIFEGAKETLAHTEVLLVEVYNFQIQRDSLLFFELCAHLRKLGFLPADMCEPMFRPGDGMLWQFDCFFMRADRPEFANTKYF